MTTIRVKENEPFDVALRRFKRTIEKLDRIELAPVSEVILDEASITRFRQNYRIEFGAAGTDDPLYEAVSAGRKHAGMEHWLPYFHDRLETLFDYLPDASIVLDDQSTPVRLSRWEGIEDQYDSRTEAMKRKDRLDSVYKPCPPHLLYLDDKAWEAAIFASRVIQLVALPQPSGHAVLDAGARIGRNFSAERQLENVSLFAALADHLKARLKLGQVIVASYSEGARERLKGLLEDEGVKGISLAGTMREVPEGKGSLFLTVWALEHGFECDGLTVISEQDVLGDRLIRGAKKRRKADNFLTEAQSLSPGDLVVHVDHGVGRYKGLETIIRALPAVLERHPDTVYLIAGATHPHLVAREGEAYRESLVTPARSLGVAENLRFVNRFLGDEELVDLLQAADLYVTPYLTEAQITSGTLAYAIAVGKPVISTPYWHAKEALADGVGVIVLAGQDNDLGVGIEIQQLLEQPEALRHRIGVGRQAQVHRHHRRRVATELQQRALAIAGGHRLEAVHRPLDLLLQRQVVLDDQQRARRRAFGCHGHQGTLAMCSADSSCASNSGSSKLTSVPLPGSLCTSMRPPSSCTYWKLS